MLQIDLFWEIWSCEKLRLQFIELPSVEISLFLLDRQSASMLNFPGMCLIVCSILLDKDLESELCFVVEDKLQQLCCL